MAFDSGSDAGRTRRLWILTLGLVAVVAMALTTVLAISPADTADPTILAPIAGTAVGALATVAALTHRDRDANDHDHGEGRPPAG